MTDQQNLQLIIETALKHGWEYVPGIKHNTEDVLEDMRDITVETLLYGDNLSLLKAACGEEREGEPRETPLGLIPSAEGHKTVAINSIFLPDSERLSFIVEHLRKD